MRRHSTLFAYSLLTPLLLVMLVLVFYPAVLTFADSFRRLNLTDPTDTRWIGLGNYLQLLRDPTVIRTVENTGWYLVIATIAETVGGLVFALALRERFRGRAVVLAAAILPWALPPVVNGVIWGWIYNPSFGVLNKALSDLHVISTYQVWMGDPRWSLPLVTLVHVWKMIPLSMVIILAALQSLPEHLYEAARIDGAGQAQLFRYITLPLILPALVIALVQSTIAAINLFDEAYVLTGTSLDTRSVLIQTYLVTFRDFNFGLGMALSFVVTFATVAVSAGYLLWLYRGRG